jgi:type I restriction enzyme S subunit
MASSSASFEVGDVLYSRMRPYLNKVVRPKFAGLASAEFIVLPATEALDSSFLLKRLSSADFVEFACSQYEGDRPRVKFDSLGKFTIDLPPRAEQTRIVAKLEELLSDLDAGVAELKAAQKKLGQYRQSLLKAAVEGALTAEWRKQQQAPLSPRGRGAGGEGANTPETDTWFRDRARELRKAQTPEEHDLWQQLRAKRFSGFKFRRQQVIGNYIVDFVCFDQKLVIELDGSQHADAKERDESRDRWLSEQGFRVLRFWNNEWMAQAESVLETIWSALHKQPPLPNPSPTRGEGLDAPFSLDGLGGASETGAQLLERILTERRARWEAKQLAKFKEQGKTPPKDWQNKYPEPSSLNDTPRTTLPAGWTWASVDQLSPDDLANGRSVPSAERGAKVLRLTAVRNGRIDLSASKHGAWTEEEAKPFAVVEGDLLIVRGNGSLPLVGRAALVPKVHEQVAYPDTLIRLRVVESVVHPAWVSLMWDSETTRTHLERRARTSAGIYKISQPDIVSVAIPVPPLAEQDEILETFAASNQSIVELELMIGTSIKQSAAQRQNILRAAFAGQLVPQDPNDEPANVLLERIRAERAARDAVKKPRGRQARETA